MTERFTLPDDLLAVIQNYANEATKQKRLLAFAIQDVLEDLPYKMHSLIYDMIADEWNTCTGDTISGRTVRYWVQSIKTFSQDEMKRYDPLTDAQLIEAVKLANDCQVEPQQICDWCVNKGVRSVPQMRAHWLPSTGTPTHTDPPALSGIIRWFGKLFKNDNPHRARIDEIIAELRGYLAETEQA